MQLSETLEGLLRHQDGTGLRIDGGGAVRAKIAPV